MGWCPPPAPRAWHGREAAGGMSEAEEAREPPGELPVGAEHPHLCVAGGSRTSAQALRCHSLSESGGTGFLFYFFFF